MADTRQVIDNLNLAKFNVIDCDCYGISLDIYEKLLSRQDVKSGTILIYTVISYEFSGLNKYTQHKLGIENFYKKASSVFNAKGINFFYNFLANHGVKQVTYYSIFDKMRKDYGYFQKP